MALQPLIRDIKLDSITEFTVIVRKYETKDTFFEFLYYSGDNWQEAIKIFEKHRVTLGDIDEIFFNTRLRIKPILPIVSNAIPGR